MCVDAPLLSKPEASDSENPQVQTPTSTENNKGDSTPHHPKSAINLVPNRDVTEASSSLQLKRTIVKPISYRMYIALPIRYIFIINLYITYFYLIVYIALQIYTAYAIMIQYRINNIKGYDIAYISVSQ